MQQKIIFSLALVLYLGVSCKKFLAEQSTSEMTPKTTGDYSELLIGTGYPTFVDKCLSELTYMDDDVSFFNYSANAQAAEIQPVEPMYCWQPDYQAQVTASGLLSQTFAGDYKTYYTLINGCNIAIQYGDVSEGTQADKDYLKGQAFGLRAYYYFILVNLYGRPYNDSTTTPQASPGVPLMLTANVSQDNPARNTVADVYRQILLDLDSAHARLDGDKQTADNFRMNYLAAHLLASRVFLYMEQWDSVIGEATYVLNTHPPLMDLNSWGVNTGWAPGSGTFIPIIGTGNVESLWTFGGMAPFYPQDYGKFYNVSTDLGTLFDANDLRSQIYLQTMPPPLYFIFSSPYMDIKRDYNNVGNYVMGNAFRTSELYLNRAEAYAQEYKATGSSSAAHAAIDDLNTLRVKRFDQSSYVPLGMMTADSLLQFCRNERRRELCKEGQRWFDLRRYGMPSITHMVMPDGVTAKNYVLKAHDPQYTLPIPTDALQLNPNLSQNTLAPERAPAN